MGAHPSTPSALPAKATHTHTGEMHCEHYKHHSKQIIIHKQPKSTPYLVNFGALFLRIQAPHDEDDIMAIAVDGINHRICKLLPALPAATKETAAARENQQEMQ